MDIVPIHAWQLVLEFADDRWICLLGKAGLTHSLVKQHCHEVGIPEKVIAQQVYYSILLAQRGKARLCVLVLQ